MVGSLMQLVAYGAQDVYLNYDITIHPYNYIKNKSLKNKQFKRKYKFITDDDKNIECPISYQIIPYGSKYYQCICCKYNFSYKSIKHIGLKNNCSVCKKKSWHNKTIYYNKL